MHKTVSCWSYSWWDDYHQQPA